MTDQRLSVLAPACAGPVPPGPRPAFSVLIPVYDAVPYVAEAVRSALHQTVPPLEVIVIDDGSTGDVEGALGDLRRSVVFLRQPNRGAAAARNAGLAVARGDWVVLLDADDAFLPGRLEALGRAAEARPDLDVLTTDAWLVCDGVPVRRCYTGGYGFELGDQRRAILRGNFVYGMVALRRRLLAAIGGFDESLRFAEDWDAVARALLSGARAGLVPVPLVRYRIHEGSKSASAVNRARGAVAVLERALAHPELRPSERALAQRELRRRRTDLALAEARAALRTARPDQRALAWRAATTPGTPPASRVKAAAAAVLPGLARLVLAHHADEPAVTGGLDLAPAAQRRRRRPATASA